MAYAAHPTYRKPLNTDQLAILFALYRFRFGTTDLLISALLHTTSRRYMNTKLKILCDQGYVGRRYDHSYRMRSKFAAYYLLPPAITVLKRHTSKLAPSVIRQVLGDDTRSERSIQHWLTIFRLYTDLKRQYGSQLKFFTRSYLTAFDYFPRPRPDAYVLTGNDVPTGQPHHYFVLCLDGSVTQAVMRARIESLVAHADSGDWPRAIAYPAILIVCYSEQRMKAARFWIDRTLSRAWANDITCRIVDGREPNLQS